MPGEEDLLDLFTRTILAPLGLQFVGDLIENVCPTFGIIKLVRPLRGFNGS